MTTLSYELNLGPSPAGGFVHSAVANLSGKYSNLADAKAAAEEYAGRRLTWSWLPERHVHRARTGYEQAAEIAPEAVVTAIRVNASTL